MRSWKILLLALLLPMFACKDKKENKTEEESMDMTRQQLTNNYVDTLILNKSTFSKQVNCNGKLRAVAKSELTMPGSGVLHTISVHNGSVVNKGDLLAVTDKEEAELELRKARQDLELAEIELLDNLIGQGYNQDMSDVPEVVLERAKIKSGYLSAQERLETAQRKLDKCYLYAPFAGRVANMNAKLYQRPDVFCSLIDDSYFDVEFTILEAEMTVGTPGQRVVVSPFIDEQKRYTGKITEVNPFIDEHGQITIRARIKNHDAWLVEGMNVRVVVESDMKDMFVVPKDAVVSRDGFYVVFRYQDSTAIWTYVDVLYANIDSYAISGCKVKQTRINEGDVIITSGNLNLADGTPVIPRAPKSNRP
ncbi:MAG: efflux RND transporter periplasmic adaptor subunit [Bacteroidales bacterium]|nr:efflux RND transporter periplasmic adaptor subunit [Bacteroidales bacterium]